VVLPVAAISRSISAQRLSASIIVSGRPRRIGAHLIRKQLYKQTSRLIRRIK